MPVLPCKWCGAMYTAVNTMENTCSRHCAQMWRRENDRMRRAEKRGEAYEVERDGAGRVIRECQRCRTRLSSLNRGVFCHPCWNGMKPADKDRMGRKGDLYIAKNDLRREREEIDAYEAEGNIPATEPAGRDTEASID